MKRKLRLVRLKTPVEPNSKRCPSLWMTSGLAACAVMVLVAIIAAVDSFSTPPDCEPQPTCMVANASIITDDNNLEASEIIKPTAQRAGPSAQQLPVLTSAAYSDVAMPNVEVSEITPQHMNAEQGVDFGVSYGVPGGGAGFGPGPHRPAPFFTERYAALTDNRFLSPLNKPLSTFSIDVDTAAYSNFRRMIRDNAPIPKDAIRIEEMVNYFSYDYKEPAAEDEHPFAFNIEAVNCPWEPSHQLLRIGIQGQKIDPEDRPPLNLVFLIDVSGSMNTPRKLPLVQFGMRLLAKELGANDRVSMVVYAGDEGLALSATPGDESEKIIAALDKLEASGSTNGGAGIELAYKLARDNFMEEGVNRVMLCTDGDFNVGRTQQDELVELVEQEAESGVFLSVLGFGTGNINDSMLEAITNDGDGTFHYVDSPREARKVLLEEITSTMVPIAKDVKIQIEFNPAKVKSYRLIGYANRMLEAKDFKNDTVDAGEVGAGHQVTALYEIVPADAEGDVDELEFQRVKTEIVPSDKLAVLKLRYKAPDGDVSTEIKTSCQPNFQDWKEASGDFQFAAGVALTGMLLRDSEFVGQGDFPTALELAAAGIGNDQKGRRAEFEELTTIAMNRS